MKQVEFFKPDLDGSELEEIKKALSPDAERHSDYLEEEFQTRLSVKHAIATTNGTSALHLCMCSIDLKRGDKIICSVNAHPSVPEVVRHFDAEPIFVDINADDFNIDLDKLEAVLEANHSKKLRGVVVTHMAGQPCDLNRLYAMAEHYGIKVVEDATQALDGSFEGNKIGSLKADATVFSFQPELFGCVSNGGMLVTNDDDLANRAQLLRFHALVHGGGWDQYENLDYVYDVLDIGCKYDISQIDAACCLAQLKRSESLVRRRQKIAEMYDHELQEVPHLMLPPKLRDHVYSLYILRVDKNRDHFAKELREKGVETSLHFIPLHLLSYYKSKYGLKVNDFPVALRNYQQTLSIPMRASLTDGEVVFICEQIKDAAGHRV